MKFVIRTDSSSTIGSGHLIRCLTLADALRRNGDSTVFVCRDLPGNLCDLVEKGGHRLHILRHPGSEDDFSGIDDMRMTIEIVKAETPVEWMIVDHYALDEKWEKPMRDWAGRVMVIDDLADRNHDCDLLLDQNFFAKGEARYNKRLPDYCRCLFGPTYAMLRPEFEKMRKNIRKRDGSISRLLISMGGADSNNLTGRAVRAAAGPENPGLMVDIVIGAANSFADEIKNAAQSLTSFVIHYPAEDMAALMAEADLCIGTAGSTTWERCCLGLPTLIIASGDNEIEIARSADAAGIGKFLGRYDEVGPDLIADEIGGLFNHPDILRSWSQAAAALVDGRGVERVCRAIIEYMPSEVRL